MRKHLPQIEMAHWDWRKCTACGGRGVVLEQINGDRRPVMVFCQECQEYCKECGKWKTKGHIHERNHQTARP